MHEIDAATSGLMAKWCRAPLRPFPAQPLHEVKDYFGERIGLYFAFMQMLVRSLVLPSALGLGVIIGAFYFNGGDSTPLDNPISPLYSVVILVWVSVFAKVWRGEQVNSGSIPDCRLSRPTLCHSHTHMQMRAHQKENPRIDKV